MKKLMFLLFAVIIAANFVSCKDHEPCWPTLGSFAGVIMDKDNNDLLDTTKINSIDLKNIYITTYDERWNKLRESHDLFILQGNANQPYHRLIDNFDPYETGYHWVFNWGDNILDTITIELKAEDTFDHTNLNLQPIRLFCNGKMVWDNHSLTQQERETSIPLFIRKLD